MRDEGRGREALLDSFDFNFKKKLVSPGKQLTCWKMQTHLAPEKSVPHLKRMTADLH